MKYTLVLLFFLASINSSCQKTDTLKTTSIKKLDVVSFIVKVDISNATKDGIYLNGYVVNLDYEQAKGLDGKKIRVTGKVSIIKGLKKSANEETSQGRESDTKHIKYPKIEIIDN